MNFFQRKEFFAAEPEVRRQFREERAANSLTLGKMLLIIGTPILAYFIYQDSLILQSPSVFAFRLIVVAAGFAYVVFLFTKWIRVPRYMIFVHSMLLFSIMLMATGTAYVIFSQDTFSLWEKSAVSSGMLLGMITVHLFSGGARPLFALIAGIPLSILLIALVSGGHLGMEDCSILTIPLFAGIFISVIAIVQEKMRFRDFARRTQALRQNKELEKLAGTDELTGLCNRRAGLAILTRLLESAVRTKTHLTLGFLDADRLKSVNDEFGHREGDLYLQLIAKTIEKVLQPCDSAARMGGDEFIVIFPGRRKIEGEGVIGLIQAELKALSRTKPFQLAVSFGLAEFDPSHPMEARDLLRLADSRMYMHKQVRRRR